MKESKERDSGIFVMTANFFLKFISDIAVSVVRDTVVWAVLILKNKIIHRMKPAQKMGVAKSLKNFLNHILHMWSSRWKTLKLVSYFNMKY